METQKQKTAGKAPAAAAAVDSRGHRRRMVGVVTSDKMDKTVVVVVTRRVRETKFGKYLVKKAKYKAHSENNGFHVGDKVEIVESRPLSKEKRWRVEKLIEKARRTAAPVAQ
jgi:small subunit ribosomal protein S17